MNGMFLRKDVAPPDKYIAKQEIERLKAETENARETKDQNKQQGNKQHEDQDTKQNSKDTWSKKNIIDSYVYSWSYLMLKVFGKTIYNL